MQKIFLSVIALVLFGFVFSLPTFAIDRYTTCDACGLCPTIINGDTPSCTVDLTKVPGDWDNCVKCLYPVLYQASSTTNLIACKTLIVNSTTNISPTVMPGRQFTMIGCISSGVQVGFNNASGASSFVQKLLDVIFALSGALAFLYLMYGGFIFLTSQADPEKLNYGRRLIYGAIVGLIITLGSVFIVNLIGSGILHIPGFSGSP